MLKWTTMTMPILWLASASPRRQEMFKWINPAYKVMVADIDESVRVDEIPEDYVRRLAVDKAAVVGQEIHSEGLIVAADTTVVLGKKILGKPTSMEDATAMLISLRQKTHQVITALVLVDARNGSRSVETCISIIEMRNYSDEEIWTYVKSGDPLDKAGAYAIQHPQFNPVVNFRGCFASVMGMPMCHLERNLRNYKDYRPLAMHQICQKFLDYTCPIHKRVLAGENIG
jgi:MAF protein